MFEDAGMTHKRSGVRVPPRVEHTRPPPPFAPYPEEERKYVWPADEQYPVLAEGEAEGKPWSGSPPWPQGSRPRTLDHGYT